MVERNDNKFEAEYGHRFCALTFRSDGSDEVHVEFSNESVEDGRPPVIRVYKSNDDNGYGMVRGYLVDESPDFRGLVTVTKEEDSECIIPVKTYDGKKTYLVLLSEVDKRNPSYAKFVIGERGTYKTDLAQKELTALSELFSVSYMTANLQDTLALRELTHFVEKYIIPRTKTNYQMHLSCGTTIEKTMTHDHDDRVCAFTFHKKTGEDVVFEFIQRKGRKMQITMDVCSGSDGKYIRKEGFITRTDEFYGRVDYHSRVNSYAIPVKQGNSNVTQLRWDFFNEPDHPKEVHLEISAQETPYDDGTVLIDEYIDTSINDSIPALQRFLELYVIPHASVNYQIHPEVK